MSDIRIRVTRRVLAAGATRQPGDIIKVSALDAATLVFDCGAAAFVDLADRDVVIDARRKENRRVTTLRAPDPGSPWQPSRYQI